MFPLRDWSKGVFMIQYASFKIEEYPALVQTTQVSSAYRTPWLF